MNWNNQEKHGLTFSLNEVNFDDCNIDFVPISLDQSSEPPTIPEELDSNEIIESTIDNKVHESTENTLVESNDNISDYIPIPNEPTEKVMYHTFQKPCENIDETFSKFNSDVEKHWFYCAIINGLAEWKPFTIKDSYNIEIKYQDLIKHYDPNEAIHADYIVSVDGGRYDVLLLNRQKISVYWQEPPMEIRRASWFYRPEDSYTYLPYSEAECEILESKYQEIVKYNLWNQSFELLIKPEGCLEDRFIFHSTNTIVQYRRYHDISSNLNEDIVKGRVVCRGVNTFKHHLEESESDNIDHVVFIIHGIGPYYDLRGSGIVECVKKMRSVSKQMQQDHFSNHNGRIEILPVSWYDILHNHDIPIDKDLSKVTLKSVPKLRNFTNNTLVDVLCYSSPKYASLLLTNVAEELNRLRDLFITRNPDFKGAFSIAGHSLGSVIAFDLICLQNESTKSLLHIVDPNSIPKFDFEVGFMFALGSPISLFLTSRGYSKLDPDFKLLCKGFYNIFHPFDPVAYRIEPMIQENISVRPVIIPHHKGRKRLHLELKDNLMRVGSDIKSKLMQTLKTTWNSLQEFAHNHKSDQQDNETEWEMLKTLEQMDSSLEMENKDIDMNNESLESELNIRIGSLNNGNRIDYVLQESPVESFNDYIFALGSHACYWESEDTVLLIMKKIFASLNIHPSIKKPVELYQQPEPPQLPSHMPPPLSLSKVHSLPVIKSYDNILPPQPTYSSIFPPGSRVESGKMGNFFVPKKMDVPQLPSQNTNLTPVNQLPPKLPSTHILNAPKTIQPDANDRSLPSIPTSGNLSKCKPLSPNMSPPLNMNEKPESEMSDTEDKFAEISLQSPTVHALPLDQYLSLDSKDNSNKPVETMDTFMDINLQFTKPTNDNFSSHPDSMKIKQESDILPPKMPFLQTPINPLQSHKDVQRYVVDKTMINSVQTPSYLSNDLNNIYGISSSSSNSKPFFNPLNQPIQNSSQEIMPSEQEKDLKPIPNILPPKMPNMISCTSATTSTPLITNRYAFDTNLLPATSKPSSSASLDILNITKKTPATFFSPNIQQPDHIDESIKFSPALQDNNYMVQNDTSDMKTIEETFFEETFVIQEAQKPSSDSCKDNLVFKSNHDHNITNNDSNISQSPKNLTNENSSIINKEEINQKSSNIALPPSNKHAVSPWLTMKSASTHLVSNDNYKSDNTTQFQSPGFNSSDYQSKPVLSYNTCLPPSNLQNHAPSHINQMNYFQPGTVLDNKPKPYIPHGIPHSDNSNKISQNLLHSQMFQPNITSNYFNPTQTSAASNTYFTPQTKSYNYDIDVTNTYPNSSDLIPASHTSITQDTCPVPDSSYFQPNQSISSDISKAQVNTSQSNLSGYFSNADPSNFLSDQSAQQPSAYIPSSLSLTPRPPSSARTVSPYNSPNSMQTSTQLRNASISPSPSSFSSSSRNQSKKSPSQLSITKSTSNNSLGNLLGSTKPLVPQSGKISRKNKSGK